MKILFSIPFICGILSAQGLSSIQCPAPYGGATCQQYSSVGPGDTKYVGCACTGVCARTQVSVFAQAYAYAIECTAAGNISAEAHGKPVSVFASSSGNFMGGHGYYQEETFCPDTSNGSPVTRWHYTASRTP